MSRRRAQEPAQDRPAFKVRLSPGDRHTYTWDGGEHATVYRHVTVNEGNGVELVPTGDLVPMDGCARTASAFSDHVRAWIGHSPT